MEVESVGEKTQSVTQRPTYPTTDQGRTEIWSSAAAGNKTDTQARSAQIISSESSDSEVPKRKTQKKKKRHSHGLSEDSSPRNPKKKMKKVSSKKQQDKDSDPSSPSDSLSDSSTSDESSSDDSSAADRAELCYEVTDFESADLPDLPDKWDKGFRKLRAYVPLTLFKSSLLENFHDDDVDSKSKEKSAVSKASLKALEKQLTYGDFIEMCDLEERYAREIYGLDTYADYVVRHKTIVSDLKKLYNCWMIGLRYHLKVRTVIFRRRKLIKSKSKGKTVLQDKVKIPNGLQPLVERQARHDADRAGDLQFVDNPYAPGGPKFGFSFTTGRAHLPTTQITTAERASENGATSNHGLRGKRAGGGKRPYVGRNNLGYQHYNRQYQPGEAHTGYNRQYQPGEAHTSQTGYQITPPAGVTPPHSGRQYYQFKGRSATGQTPKPPAIEPQTT